MLALCNSVFMKLIVSQGKEAEEAERQCLGFVDFFIEGECA